MSWLFSRALVEEFSQVKSSATEPCAQLSVMPTQHQFWRKDKTMEPSQFSRFGLTFALLTADRGAELLSAFLAASRAKTSAPQDSGLGLMALGLRCGFRCPESFARLSLDLSVWKTAQSSLLADSGVFCATWPKWGSMRSGVCWEREPWAAVTQESESGFSHPTPTARDWKGASNGQKDDFSRWTTWLHKNVSHGHYTTYPNPSCSEAVMGWPTEWTGLAPLEMGKFRKWQQQHSPPLPQS